MKKLLIILISFLVFTTITFSSENEFYEKGKIIKILNKIKPTKDETNIKYKLKTIVLIETGPEKGKKIILNHPIFKEKRYSVFYSQGAQVVLYASKIDKSSEYEYNIIDLDKRGTLILLGIIFFVLVFIVGRFQGLKSILALLITVLLIFYGFMPLLIKGYSPILLAVLLSIVSSIVTVSLITGLREKGKIALIGTSLGVILSGMISLIFVKHLHISGFTSLESIYSANYFKGINVKQLVSAGIIIGSLGAIMDVAISIASSLEEIYRNNPEISRIKLFSSGMNIGKDIIGTMVNTLILAYIGSSLFTVLLLMIQKQNFPMIRILNFEFIVTEILRAMAGSIGILIVVPVTSYFGALLYQKRRDIEK